MSTTYTLQVTRDGKRAERVGSYADKAMAEMNARLSNQAMEQQGISNVSFKAAPFPVDQELFNKTAPEWNCVYYPGDGMHYVPGTGDCRWCGMTPEQMAAEQREAGW